MSSMCEPEIGEDAQPFVAPGRIADIARRPVAVKESGQVNPAEALRLQNGFHVRDMRFEAMVVGGVTGSLVRAPSAMQFLNLLRAAQQRFFDQRMFAVAEQVAQNGEFCLVRNADKRGVIRLERHFLDRLVIGTLRHRIDDRHHLISGDRAALAALHPETDDRESHSKRERFSSALSFFKTASGATGLFPSCSHATAAARAPRMEPMTFDFVATIERVA